MYQYPGGQIYHGRPGFKNSFWNRAYDHKLYLQVDPPLNVGQRVEYTHEIVPFRASPSDWTTVAAGLVQGWPQEDRHASSLPSRHGETAGGGVRTGVGIRTASVELDLVDESASSVWIGHPAVGEVRDV